MGFKHLRYYSHNYSSELIYLIKKEIELLLRREKGIIILMGKEHGLIDDSIYDQYGMLN